MKKSSLFSWLNAHGSLACLIGQVTLLGFFTTGCKPESTELPTSVAEMLAVGAESFDTNCAQCHYDGSATETMPALKGSAALTGNPTRVINIILHGQRGISEVNGRKLNGIMPPQGYLDDAEIAAIVTYIRSEFGNGGAPVTAAEVQALR